MRVAILSGDDQSLDFSIRQVQSIVGADELDSIMRRDQSGGRIFLRKAHFRFDRLTRWSYGSILEFVDSAHPPRIGERDDRIEFPGSGLVPMIRTRTSR